MAEEHKLLDFATNELLLKLLKGVEHGDDCDDDVERDYSQDRVLHCLVLFVIRVQNAVCSVHTHECHHEGHREADC
jgi:hypothetical protein